MTLDKTFFRQVMGQFATGVTVVTTRTKTAIAGITVNAFCSVSLEPPLVLVCIDLNSNTLPSIRESGTFVVNILTDKQEHLSRCFATNSDERFEHFCHASFHTAATGSPVIDDVLAFVDARIVAEYPAGDHVIFIGQVEAMGTDGKVAFVNGEEPEQSTISGSNGHTPEPEKAPLGYYRGQYRHLTETYQAPSLAPSTTHEVHHS